MPYTHIHILLPDEAKHTKNANIKVSREVVCYKKSKCLVLLVRGKRGFMIVYGESDYFYYEYYSPHQKKKKLNRQNIKQQKNVGGAWIHEYVFVCGTCFSFFFFTEDENNIVEPLIIFTLHHIPENFNLYEIRKYLITSTNEISYFNFLFLTRLFNKNVII